MDGWGLFLIILRASIPAFLYILIIIMAFIGYKRTGKTSFILLFSMGICSLICNIISIYMNFILIAHHNFSVALFLSVISYILGLISLILLTVATYLFAYEQD